MDSRRTCIECGVTLHGRQRYYCARHNQSTRGIEYIELQETYGPHAKSRTMALTDKANDGIELARRNMVRRALGLSELKEWE